MTSLANKRSLVAIFMVLSMFLFRPSILGGDSTVFGLALMLLVYTYNNVVCARGRYSDRFVGSNEFLFWVWVCVYSVYCLLLTLVQGDSDLGFALKGLVSLVVSVFLFASVVSDKNMAQVIFRYFAILNSFLGWSIAVTLLLLNIVPYESLHMITVSVQS